MTKIIEILLIFDLLLVPATLLYAVKQTKKKEEVSKKIPKRTHVQPARISLSNPLSPYEQRYDQYKDKSTNLFPARKMGGGVKIDENIENKGV